jgi:beta-N-acetylhexosaminidase
MLPLYASAAVFLASVSVALTPEQKAGRLLMPTIDAAFVEAHAEDIRAGLLRAGMLAWDKHDADELRALRARLDELTGPDGRFLLAVDHEGGALFTQRSAGLTIFPGNMALGATGDAVEARVAARASAFELAALGVDMVFAPVADVNSDPENPIISIRAFGDLPDEVARFAASAVRGYEEGGVIPVLKHFPGHGDTDVDSHSGLPTIDKSSARVHAVDLFPFKNAFAEGAQAVMTAHIRVPSIGADEPATFSRAVVGELLREGYGFEGVVVSDSLEMGAVAKTRSVGQASVDAVRAGCDLLLTGRASLPEIRRRLATEIDEGRLDASVARIAALEKRPGDFSRKKLPSPKFAARKIAERSVTLLRDRGGLLPLKGRGSALMAVVFRSKRFEREAGIFESEFKQRFSASEVLVLDPKPAAKDAAEAVRRARLAGKLVVLSYHWGKSPNPVQRRLISRMLQMRKPVVLVSAMSPYDTLAYPEANTVLLTYGFTAPSLRAAVRLLSGEIEPRGRLPASISDRVLRGDGLQRFSR